MKTKIVNYLLSKEWFMSIVRQKFIDAIKDMEVNTFALGCGLEDRGITDRYCAMEYGVERMLDKSIEAIENVV